MRQIDADVVIKHIEEYWEMVKLGKPSRGMTAVIQNIKTIINSLPTVDAEPHWIPCSERLPEEMGEYMTCDERGNIHIFFHSPECFRFPFGIRPDNPRYYEPIAWMPLPKPYEVNNE